MVMFFFQSSSSVAASLADLRPWEKWDPLRRGGHCGGKKGFQGVDSGDMGYTPVPMTDPYMVTWIPSIYPLYVSIYIYTIHGSYGIFVILFNFFWFHRIHRFVLMIWRLISDSSRWFSYWCVLREFSGMIPVITSNHPIPPFNSPAEHQ